MLFFSFCTCKNVNFGNSWGLFSHQENIAVLVNFHFGFLWQVNVYFRSFWKSAQVSVCVEYFNWDYIVLIISPLMSVYSTSLLKLSFLLFFSFFSNRVTTMVYPTLYKPLKMVPLHPVTCSLANTLTMVLRWRLQF